MNELAMERSTVRATGNARGSVEVTASMTLAGFSVVLGRMLTPQVPVFLIGALSLIAALAVMAVFQTLKLRELRLLSGEQLKYMALQALFGIVLFRVFTLFGLKFTTAADAGIILSMTPGILTGASVILLKERPSRIQIVGVGFALAAALIINVAGVVSNPNSGLGGIRPGSRVLGNVLIFCAVLSEALLTIFRKKSGGSVSSITNTSVLCLMSLCVFLPFALIETRTFPLSGISPRSWLGLLLYGAVGTSFAYMLWGDGSARVPASATGAAMAALPVSALILSRLILNESVSPAHIVGCTAGVLGIVLGTYGSSGRKRSPVIAKARRCMARHVQTPGEACVDKTVIKGGKLRRRKQQAASSSKTGGGKRT